MKRPTQAEVVARDKQRAAQHEAAHATVAVALGVLGGWAFTPIPTRASACIRNTE